MKMELQQISRKQKEFILAGETILKCADEDKYISSMLGLAEQIDISEEELKSSFGMKEEILKAHKVDLLKLFNKDIGVLDRVIQASHHPWINKELYDGYFTLRSELELKDYDIDKRIKECRHYLVTYAKKFDEKSAERFAELYQNDKVQNLIERRQYFAEVDKLKNVLRYVDGIVENRRDWIPLAINDNCFAYTMGLQYNFSLPEILLVTNPEDSLQSRSKLLHFIGSFAIHHKAITTDLLRQWFIDTESDDIVNRQTVEVKPYRFDFEQDFPYGYLREFYMNFADTGYVDMVFVDLR